ncbi:MAG: RNA polymerase sigma factor [Bacilli bacterium]
MDINKAIEKLKERDEEAFEYIYNETKEAVYAMILSIIRDRSLAEDVMQDTYMKAIQSIYQFKEGNSFKNWILTIAKNQAIDYYRKRKRELLIDASESEFMLPHEAPRTSLQLEMDELLDILTVEERQIVTLKIVDDMKHKDIAKLLDKKIGTVMWLYNQAMKKMQKKGEVNNEKTGN